MRNPKQEIECVENLANEFPECKILFVSNVIDSDFSDYSPSKPNIHKFVSGKKYSISKAINLAIDKITDETYFCFVQSDVIINRKFIGVFEKIASDVELKTGVIGTARRNNFNTFNRRMKSKYGVDFYKVIWSDSVMFFRTDLIQSIGRFNEEYLGDKESQEYCYRAHEAGFSNYYVIPSDGMVYKHNSVPFNNKVKTDKNEFLNTVSNTRKLFWKEWTTWEKNQKHLFV
jgi:hypothetical protein